MTIGGREWKAITNSTLEHDFWTMGQIRAAGLDRVVIEEGEKVEEFFLRIQREAINHGRAFLLLGGFLMPAEVDPLDWSEEMAIETANFFRKLTDPADKRVVQLQFASMLAGFFANGLASLMTSRKSSEEAGGGEASIETEGSSTSETGITSSES
jgi:hypothetical protein